MTDLTRLQTRINEAFSKDTASVAEPQKRVTITPPPLSAEAVFESRPIPAEPHKRGASNIGPALFGGGALLASAAVLGFGGQDVGLNIVFGGLAAVSLGAMVLHFLNRAPKADAVAPVAQPVLKRTASAVSDAPVKSVLAKADEAKPQAALIAQDAVEVTPAPHRNGEDARTYGTIHDALGDIVVTRDVGGRILAANAVFRALTACPSPEGRTCEALGLVFDATGKPGQFEVEILSNDGPRSFRWHDVKAREPGTGRSVIQSVARDVTDERLLARAREEARKRAEAQSAAKSRMLATVSHEIRTPLGGILGLASLLSRTRTTPEQENYLAGIRQSGEALGQLVDELLDFAAIEAGRFTLHPEKTALRPFVEGVAEMLAHRAHAKGIEVAVTVAANVPETLVFDPARLRQVLFNVIGNAVKFTRHGGVLIKATYVAGELVLTVTDTGPGMTEAETGCIFGEFEQVGDTCGRSGGTGLGLFISLRLMKALGGNLNVESRKDIGSTFIIRLPAPAGEAKGADRSQRLAASNVLLIAPAGPAADATVSTLTELGARCCHLTSAEAAASVAATINTYTDVIVDHRLSSTFSRIMPDRVHGLEEGPRRIFLFNPEERTARGRGDFDAWLIRPLREKSLTEVLSGRLRGIEKRDALNDNRPLPGFAVAGPNVAPATGLSVLLAEDDPVNAMLARTALEKAGYRVTHVSDFEAVREVVLGSALKRPDLLITDLHMPGGDGVEMIGRIRAAEKSAGMKRMPVLVLTADRRKPVVQKARLSGADGVIDKPAAPDRLVEEVKLLCAMAEL